jgi:hypothetical protein
MGIWKKAYNTIGYELASTREDIEECEDDCDENWI